MGATIKVQLWDTFKHNMTGVIQITRYILLHSNISNYCCPNTTYPPTYYREIRKVSQFTDLHVALVA